MRPFCLTPKSPQFTDPSVIFFGQYSFASSTSRGSGTFATPTCVADAPPFPSTCAFVNIRNSVVFPTCGSPITPVFTPSLSIRYFPSAQTNHPSTPLRFPLRTPWLGLCRVRLPRRTAVPSKPSASPRQWVVLQFPNRSLLISLQLATLPLAHGTENASNHF